MEKKEIIKIFVFKKILSDKSNLIRRPFNWRSHFDDEAQLIFNEFKKSYRSDEEAWFCLCRNIELPICPICGKKKVKFTGITKNGGLGYNTVCEDCSANQVKDKLDKFKKTIDKRNIGKEKPQKKYVGRGSNYKSEEFKEYAKHIKLEKYGNENFNNRKKCEDTMLKKYGVRFVGQSPEAQAKSQAKKREKIHQIEVENDCIMFSTLLKKFGQGFKKLDIPKLKIGCHIFIKNEYIPIIEQYANEGCHTNNYTSKLEKELLEYVKTVYNGQIIENDTSSVPNLNFRTFELDIYLPELKLAIDFDGLYWHSTKYKDMYYHQRKTECCRKAGISILHIYEDEWKNDQDKIKLIIKGCIKGDFKNIVSEENGILIGRNDFPVFGNYKIIKITEPTLHTQYDLSYYDAGKIYYKEIK